MTQRGHLSFLSCIFCSWKRGGKTSVIKQTERSTRMLKSRWAPKCVFYSCCLSVNMQDESNSRRKLTLFSAEGEDLFVFTWNICLHVQLLLTNMIFLTLQLILWSTHTEDELFQLSLQWLKYFLWNFWLKSHLLFIFFARIYFCMFSLD